MKNVLLAGIALVACATFASSAPEETARRPRTDRYGDPLPEGAIARLGTLRLRGCQGPVVFSPDGKHLVAAGGDVGAQAIFWDLTTGRRVKTLTAKGTIWQLVFSPDGKQLAAINDGNFNPVWDVGTGKELFTFTGSYVAFHANGKQIVSIRYSHENKIYVRTFDTVTGRQLSEWPHPYHSGVSLSPDGRFAAVQFKGETELTVFDLAKKIEVKKLAVNLGQRIWSSGFSRDGRHLVVGGEKRWTVWDWKSGKSLQTWSGRVYIAPVFSPDGRRLIWIGSNDEDTVKPSLWIVDVDGGHPRRIKEMNLDYIGAAPPAYSPDGKSVAIVNKVGVAVVLDAQKGRYLLPLDAHTDRVWRVAFTPDAHNVITYEMSRVLVWEAATGRLLRRLPDDLPAGEKFLFLITSHRWMVTGQSAGGSLRLRDLATGKEVRRLKGKHGFATEVHPVSAVSLDGTAAAILGPTGVRVYDLDNGDIRCHFTTEHPIWSMDFSADGRTLVVTIQDFQKGLLTTFRDARTGRNIETPKASIVRRSRGGRWLGLSDETKARLRQLKLLDNEGRPIFAGEDGFITGVCESLDGRYLAVQGRTGLPHVIDPADKSFLRIWDRTTHRPIADIDPKHQHQLGLFSADGRTFVSTSWAPATIHLWETATGRERLRLKGHTAGDVRLAFRPDSRVLVSGGADTQVFLWDITGRAPDGVWRGTNHSPERLRQLWGDLAGEDAARAYRAMWSLVAAPTQAVALIRKYLHPVASVGPQRLAQLLSDLDSDSFAVRSQASQKLELLGELAEPSLRKSLENRPTLETRRRCKDLLEKLSVLSGQRLQAVRAVEVLEHLGTAEARRLLEKLAQGDPAARLTREAHAALNRVTANRSLQGGG